MSLVRDFIEAMAPSHAYAEEVSKFYKESWSQVQKGCFYFVKLDTLNGWILLEDEWIWAWV